MRLCHRRRGDLRDDARAETTHFFGRSAVKHEVPILKLSIRVSAGSKKAVKLTGVGDGGADMLLADTMAIFFVITGLLITFPSLWLLCLALWPRFVQRTCTAVEGGLLRSFLIGIPITVLAIVIIVIVGKLPASFGQIGGILTFSLLMLFAQAGVSGLATQLGRRLKSPADLDRPWKATLRGGIVLALSYLLPLVGWFLILPASIIVGAGSSLRACFQSNNPASASECRKEMQVSTS